ncbi:MAG: NAD(P)-dependent oxidoreductase [Candidatus Doudnabacteria bacterium]|nr:NAD(P)-dependent oxidoreductase [Candidatus Doudnabacteria bacterium]
MKLFNERKKILITGGAGYIGGYLTDLLLNKGYDVTVYDNLLYESSYRKNVSFIYGDVRDQEKLGRIINDFDIVIWLAAIVGDRACSFNPDLTRAVNVDSVAWLVKNFRGKIVFMSTCSVYGVNENLLDENSPVNPLSHYASSKLVAEQILLAQADQPLVFRLGTLFGLSDFYSRIRLDLVANILTKQAAFGETLIAFGGGQWRPLLHVRDVAHAILYGIERKIVGLYNLSYKNYQIREIAEAIVKHIPTVRVSYHNIKFEDLRNYKVSADKYRALGWQPRFTLTDGITEIAELFGSGRIKNPDDPVYSNEKFIKNRII